MDGHKLKINPHAVQLRSSDLVVLDSSQSVFYTLPFPISQESVVVKRLSGKGEKGYADGEPGLAQFNKPKSFAVDLRGNVYVADQLNHAVRKISNSGVTSTIVGNYSQKGRQDGPGKTATFSSDFEVLFVPQICALLISDHGNQLLRQIDLKPEDCTGRHQPQDMEALPNQSGESNTDELLRRQKRRPRVSNKHFVSLMDADINSCVVGKSQTFADQLKELIDLNDFNVPSQLSSSASDILKLGEGGQERRDASSNGNGRINDMIQANFMGFVKLANETTPVDVPVVGSMGLVKRR
ncbi:unnamed protein product [Dovyalis caffra]|uniref:NHL repeat-containing protein 2 n=1 Tax=Dovyalis caffra TaxID=77055 RepID=A0AAV1RQQ5_9ROSI|nr:unnamed protein product [Dovyalis caffra]